VLSGQRDTDSNGLRVKSYQRNGSMNSLLYRLANTFCESVLKDEENFSDEDVLDLSELFTFMADRLYIVEEEDESEDGE
jgi:hypothetical protein